MLPYKNVFTNLHFFVPIRSNTLLSKVGPMQFRPDFM
jgi:hypothetical protein